MIYYLFLNDFLHKNSLFSTFFGLKSHFIKLAPPFLKIFPSAAYDENQTQAQTQTQSNSRFLAKLKLKLKLKIISSSNSNSNSKLFLLRHTPAPYPTPHTLPLLYPLLPRDAIRYFRKSGKFSSKKCKFT